MKETYTERVTFPCPGKCGKTVSAGYMEPSHDPTVLHPMPSCDTFNALDPDELVALANKASGRTEGFDA